MGINVAFDIVDNTDDIEPTIAAINYVNMHGSLGDSSSKERDPGQKFTPQPYQLQNIDKTTPVTIDIGTQRTPNPQFSQQRQQLSTKSKSLTPTPAEELVDKSHTDSQGTQELRDNIEPLPN